MTSNEQFVKEALGRTAVFFGLSEEALERLAPLFLEKTYQKDQTLFRQGEQGEALVVIVSGQVTVEKEIIDGRRVTLALRGPGAVLGEMALLDGAARSASVYALESTTCLALDRGSFYRFLAQHSKALQGLLMVLCQRLRESDRKVEDLGSKTLLQRLAGALLELAQAEGTTTGQGVELSSVVNYQLLTGLLCTNRESVSRAARELRAMGLLAKNGRKFLLADLQGLSDLYLKRPHSTLLT